MEKNTQKKTEKVNPMCENCGKFGGECQGTTEKAYTGCVYRTIKEKNTTELYINGIYSGECKSYEQSIYKDKENGKCNPGWLFIMENGKQYHISFDMIKLFTSNGKLNIITKDGDVGKITDSVKVITRNKNRIPVNNGRYKRVEAVEDGIYIYTENEHGALLEMGERISGKDFISMLNWYKYQKENGNPELLF